MRKVTLRGLAARKLRTILTASAVVLGVAMISGTYVLTDTINRSFNGIFKQATAGVDVSVTPHEVISQDKVSAGDFPEALLAKARAVDGVRKAAGGIFTDGTIYKKNGKRSGLGGAPNIITTPRPAPFDPFTYTQGRPPRTADEVALDRFTAQKAGYHIGDLVRIAGSEPAKRYRLVGLAKFGSVESLGGASLAILDLREAQRATGEQGKLQVLDLQADAGVTPQQLRTRVRAALPRTVTVRTGKEEAQAQSDDTKQGFSFITTFLLVFAGVALFVGAFMIFNTFSITVAQRTREFAMLRTLGASRRQVLRSVVGEAALVGILASLVGLLLGLGIAPGLRALFKLLGAELPSSGTVIATRTILVSLIVGSLVTLVASLMPAIRATRVSPVEALHEGAVLPRSRGSRLRTPLAIALTLIGVGVMVYGLFGPPSGGSAAALLGLGAALVFVGVGLLSSLLVKPLTRVAGAPLRGITGQLARENAMRNPGRTASTAAALMIGVALIAFVAVFAAGLKKGLDDAVDNQFHGQLVLENSQGFGSIPTASAAAVRAVPGVQTVSEIRFSEGKRVGEKGGNPGITGVDPATFGTIYTFQYKRGSNATLRGLGPDDVLAKDGSDFDKVGRRIRLRTPTDRVVTLTVRGTYKDRGGLLSDLTMPASTISSAFGNKDLDVALVSLAPGAAVPATQARIERVLKARYPTAETKTKKQFKDQQAGQLNQVLTLFYVLLSLSVIISLFGIVNTLALSIHERTRELGLLRAVGTSRRQVRRMIRGESIITAVIGAVIGAVLGFFFAVIVTRPLSDEGFVLTFPAVTLLVLLLLAILAGIVAAIAPARRASRMDVLEALAYE